MPAKLTTLDEADLVRRYANGESALTLGRGLGISPGTVMAHLASAGVRLRTISEANVLRMARYSAAEVAALTIPAHEARRAKPSSAAELASRARGKQIALSHVGNGELMVAGWLRDVGLSPVLQQAIGAYNLDLGISPVAVELLVTGSMPLNRPQDRRKIKYLTECGWWVLYVWMSTRFFPNPLLAKDILAFYERAKANPSPVGEYRVIRGTGELVAAGCGDLD